MSQLDTSKLKIRTIALRFLILHLNPQKEMELEVSNRWQDILRKHESRLLKIFIRTKLSEKCKIWEKWAEEKGLFFNSNTCADCEALVSEAKRVQYSTPWEPPLHCVICGWRTSASIATFPTCPLCSVVLQPPRNITKVL